MPRLTASWKPEPIAPVFVLTENTTAGFCATIEVAHCCTFCGSKLGSQTETFQPKILAIWRVVASTPMLCDDVAESWMTPIVLPFGTETRDLASASPRARAS